MTDETTPGMNSPEKMPRWIIRAIVIFWIGFIATLVLRFSFSRLHSLLLLLLFSLFLALAIEPGVNRLIERGWGRKRATGGLLVVLIFVTIGFVAAIGTVVGSQIADLLQNSEQYVNDSVKFVNDTFNTSIDPAEVNDKINDPDGPVQDFISSQQDQVVKVSVKALGVLFQGLSVLLFTYYLVADGPRLRRAICGRLKPQRQRRVLDTWELAITKTGGYLYSRALLAAVSAFFHWILFQSVGTPAPVALALWVGLVSQFLPVVGTYLAGVLPLLLTLLNSPVRALIVLGFIMVYQQVENYVLAPRITARTLELHPALAFGSAIAGGALLGPIGAVLALPGAAMMQALSASWGIKHDVIEDPLTVIVPPKPKKQRRTGSP
ncbi:MAG: AI-2E family transporter [Ilumatobacteraceae bacterium]|nr:AI-2E family transporter [Ilumatobacteraceae bacterium]